MKKSNTFIEQTKEKSKKIHLDLSRDSLLDKISLDRIKDSYFMTGESSPQHRYAFVSTAFWIKFRAFSKIV